MKHTTEELLLAAQVRALASGMAAREVSRGFTAWRVSLGVSGRPTQEEKDDMERSLAVVNPVMKFVPEAMRELAAVAEAIKTMR